MTYAETLEARVRELERRIAELEAALRYAPDIYEKPPANG
jgi:exonuclease VII small subunit